MSPRLCSLGWVILLACFALSCKTTGPSTVSSLTPPASGARGVALQREPVLKAMREASETFYLSGDIYEVPYAVDSSGNKLPPNQTDPQTCYSSCPKDRWSPLICTYFCQFPAYGNVVPNIRGCFVRVVQYLEIPIAGQSTKRVLSYDEAYDYCVYQNYDAVKQRIPAFDLSEIARNKAAGTKPGVMKWIDDNQRDVFKYLMFTNGNPKAFDANDTKWVLDAFKSKSKFGVADY